MLRIGFHVSITGAMNKAVDRAASLDCNTFQIFTRTPRAWSAKQLTIEETESFIDKVARFNMYPVFAHIPYLVNFASANYDVYMKSVETLKQELERCNQLKIPYLVTHLGSHLGAGKQRGIEKIVSAIDVAFQAAPDGVMLLLENTAGTRNSVGDKFEDIQQIIDSITVPDFVGVCFDTAHAYASGYDLSSFSAVETTIRKLKETIGFNQLKLIHLNDSLNGLGAGIDRHEHIGLGNIGEEGFRAILHSKFAELPLILETPKDLRRDDSDNLWKVRELASTF